jgi:hypothetical protein
LCHFEGELDRFDSANVRANQRHHVDDPQLEGISIFAAEPIEHEAYFHAVAIA